ncbi:MAG: AMP-binding protein [Clostridiales bacterium]|nr:AMP-binding protein [Clostridiales bacterium]
MYDLNDYYKQFVTEELDKEGRVLNFALNLKDNYNFSYDVIDGIAAIEPDRVAIQWINEEGEEHKFTFRELSEKSNQVANMFLAHGAKKGDMVMAVLKRHYEFWFLIYGLMKIGVVSIPATDQLMVKDYIYRFESASVKYVVATGEGHTTNQIEESIETYKGIEEKFIVHGTKDGWTSFLEEIEKYPKTLDRVETNIDETMLLYFSSGTTGYPKMVLHNYRYSASHILTAKHWHHVDKDSLHLTISDTGWGKCAWGKLFGQLACGATVFIYDFGRFNPAKMMQVIQDYGITSFCAPPTMYRFFIKEGIENYDLSKLKYATIAGEALNPEVFNKFYEYTGLKLMEGFGQTETVICAANLYGMEPKPGSMGRPVPLYNVDIVDEEGNSLPNGEVGEMVIRTEGRKHDSLFTEYYRDPEGTALAWHDNLYHTGDTAWRDEDGYLWYVGRTDDLIKASGYRIGPFEIESVLMEHPSVLECAVTGAKDEIRGNVVKATIVLSKGYTGSDELIKELQAYVKNATAPYKYPRIVEFVDELPKTISGKIRRVEIRNKGDK